MKLQKLNHFSNYGKNCIPIISDGSVISKMKNMNSNKFPILVKKKNFNIFEMEKLSSRNKKHKPT